MATTNIPTQTARDEAVERAKANSVAPAAPASKQYADEASEPGVSDLDKQAREIVESRASDFFDSTVAGARARMNAELTAQNATADYRKQKMDEFQKNSDDGRKKAVDEAMAVYEDAVKRRGPRQAAMDQMQGAIGLPADPKRRQIEIERRTKEGDAAMQAQSGVGTVADNLEGRLVGTRIDEYFGDAARAEFNPHVQDGHGQNIAAMAQASHRLQQIAPEAPMTQENVNDPHGAKDRMEKDRAQQASKPVVERADQRGEPGGHPATAGGLQATDPLMPNLQKQQGNPVAGSQLQDARRQDANSPKQDAHGLTKEQLAQRDRVAGATDPS